MFRGRSVLLTLKAKNDHLQKVASTRDYVKAIAEFVWNSLDADSLRTVVEFSRNALGGLESIIVRDGGIGISKARAEHDFESLGESWKLGRTRTLRLGRAIHGKEGQGRLRFFSLARRAVWDTVYEENGKKYRLSISIDADQLQTSSVSEPAEVSWETSTGTTVELTPLKDTFDWLASEEARSEFDSVFAPYILQYPNVEISYDGRSIDPQRTIEAAHEFKTQPIICPNRVVRDLTLRLIEWKPRVTGRKIYFGGETGVVLGSIPANVTAPGFEFSAYAYSPFFTDIAKANLLEFDGLSDPDFKCVLEHIRDQLTDYFRQRQAEKSGELIQDLIDAGVYPYEGTPKDEVEKRERQVFDIATHAAVSYSRDFKKADYSLKKIALGLLKEALRSNPDSVTRIMTAVFNLPKIRQDEFSLLLEKTELGSIIASSSMIADRIVALEVLRQMVFEPKHRRTIKERGELDVLVRDNTWIFGEGFHLTMAETGLTRIMDRVSEEIATKRAKGTQVRKPDGKIGRIDSFMGRLVPSTHPGEREYLLIELKRPSLKVGRKEMDQLEDYVNAILAQPDFITTKTRWSFYLVTSDYDTVVEERITQENRPKGLFIDKPNHKVWIKSWGELLRDCDARLAFVQEQLRIDVSTDEIQDRIARLKASIIRADAPGEGVDDAAANIDRRRSKIRGVSKDSGESASP